MNILGVSAGFHDAAATVVDPNGNILFAGHSERYSKIKNDAGLDYGLLHDVDRYGPISHVAYYERPWAKQLRRAYTGEGVQWSQLTTKGVVRHHTGARYRRARRSSHNHHLCHAAAGFQTSPFDRATCVVIDAIGEWETITIWGAEYDSTGRAVYKRLWAQNYPHSLGLFYSAITGRIGLRILEDEYVTMGMAAYGRDAWYYQFYDKLIQDPDNVMFKENLHLGLDKDFLPNASDADLAATAQVVAEELINSVMQRAAELNFSTNLVYGGGVALNCLANRNLGKNFSNIWILPNPGDAGNSLGAAALAYGHRLNWTSAYLGHDIPGDYPVNDILDNLVTDRMVGVASGRAEFGPRALGNRSLLADPRGPDIKDKVNAIKRRQQFRPFAPVILEELAPAYFHMPNNWHDSRYMQVVARCRNPELFPAIVHADGTSRVQTVPKDGSGIRKLLEKWYVMTDCPMLLNTSLNIRGEPMVNDRDDADRFEMCYGVKVCS